MKAVSDRPRERPIDYSIVIPVFFNEGEAVRTFLSIREDVIDKVPGRRAEVVFVDDGSGDDSFDELLRLQTTHRGLVRLIKLTRNFGQVNALKAGFVHARGKCVVAISADGQDPPGLIVQMLGAFFDEGFDIVVCTRTGRDESVYRLLTSRLFYWMMKRISFPQMPVGGFDFFLLSRRALNVIIRNWEAHTFLQGQVLWTGFKTKFVGYTRRKRPSGRSRWSFSRKLTYLIDGVLSNSFLPIRLISLVGMAFALFGFAYAVLILLLKTMGGIPVEGWAPLMIVLLFIGGVQMLMLGIIGEYLWRALAQIRNRDSFVVERICEDDARAVESTTLPSREGREAVEKRYRRSPSPRGG